MTVGELQKILEEIQDKNMPVLFSEPHRPPVITHFTRQEEMAYRGDGLYSWPEYSRDGEPERVLIIQ